MQISTVTGLMEVQRVSERILSHMEDERCADVRTELQQVWHSLGSYYSHSTHNHVSVITIME